MPSIRVQIGLAVATVIGYLSGNVAPLLLGAAQDGMALSGGEAGLLTTLEFVAFGACAVAISPWLPRLPRRRIIVFGALFAAVAHAGSALAPSYAMVALCRAAAGAGHGVVVATTFAVVASFPISERIYARCYAAVLVFAAAAYFAIPRAVAEFGYRGAYVLVAVFIAALVPVVVGMGKGQRSGSHAGGRPSAAAVLALVAAGVVAFSDGMVWTMSERIGVFIGVATERIAWILGPSLVMGLLGSFAADRLGLRRGLALPLFIGIWATAISGLVITTSAGQAQYIAGAVLKNITMFFLLPYMLGTAAALDPQGRAAGATGGVIPMGYGLGPYASGLISDRWGYSVIGLVGIGVVVVASLLYIGVFRTGALTRIRGAASSGQ